MSDLAGCTHYCWNDMPKEKVSDQLSRRLVTGDRMMLAHVYLKKGCVVPRHQHENEQLTYILEGALKFFLGEDGKKIIMVKAGEVLHIPSNVWHEAHATEICPPSKSIASGITRSSVSCSFVAWSMTTTRDPRPTWPRGILVRSRDESFPRRERRWERRAETNTWRSRAAW